MTELLESLKDLYETSIKIIDLHNQLKKELDGQIVENIKEKYPNIVTVLVGGVKESEDGSYCYLERSISKFRKEIMGIVVSADIFEKYKINDPLTSKIEVKDTDFISFVKNIKNQLENIIYLYDRNFIEDFHETELNLNDFFENPDLFLSLIKDFLQKLLNIMPNYNEESFKIWTLEMLTYRYIVKNYPEFKDEVKFKEFCEKFGYEKFFVPDTENEKYRKEYTIYRFKENSIGKLLRDLFLYVWNNYSIGCSCIEEFITPLPSIKYDFLTMANEKLEECGIKESDYSEYGNGIIIADPTIKRAGVSIAKYYIKGCSIVKIYTLDYSNRGNPYKDNHPTNKSIFPFLDKLMPLVFFYQDLKYKLTLENQGDYWCLSICKV